MFYFEYPVFEHKNLLKKTMLDQLRDYPMEKDRLLYENWGDGILNGIDITWENDLLTVTPGLLLHEGKLYRMNESCSFPCQHKDRLTWILVRFVAMDYARDRRGGMGEICLSEEEPKKGEMELGRFRLQEGARLRTSYENFEDYRTQFDTVNRIQVPYTCSDGAGLWPRMLCVFAEELLTTGTKNPVDINFAMQMMANGGKTTSRLVRWFVEKNLAQTNGDNQTLYAGLYHILKERRSGGVRMENETGRRQMVLL